ncbi:hypothetical protein BV898_15524 [Hypsibius exemplaris]|uniref:Receptor ligand binding region domain-containing protein n=1 Tax=Hypsibius exemplaris TaxID=2072580 RepID=A0A9X6RKK8_HYPEX|nr:hypothetical protein BV898_15524 [Hypsibius exemplaris]
MSSDNFNITGRVLQVEVITLAVIYPLMLGGLAYVGPAFDSARDDIRNKYPMLNFTQTIIYRDNLSYLDWLSEYENVLALYYYRIRRFSPENPPDVTAFVMPGADAYVTGVGRFATELDKLVLTSVAQASDFRNKDKWPTWITTGSISRAAIRTLFENLVKLYNWQTSSIICDVNSNSIFEAYSAYIRQVLQAATANAQVNRYVFDSRRIDMDYEKLLQLVKDTSRVIFYWGHANALHKLLIAAFRINMTEGDYVFLAFLPFRHVSFGDFGWTEVSDNGNSREHEMSPHPTSTYMTMMALAEVVEEIRTEIKSSYSSKVSVAEFGGRRCAARFINRTFTTDQTDSLTIDQVGERIVPMAVTQLDTETGIVSVVLQQDTVQLKLRVQKRVIWPHNAWPVPARPFCGFHGEASACKKSVHHSIQYGLGFGCALLGIVVISVLFSQRMSKSLEPVKDRISWWIIEPKLLRLK